jgi:hypothetical protein
MFTTALVDLADMLKAAGLNASIDPVDVSPPGVVVAPAAIAPAAAKLCGSYPLRVVLSLVVPDTTTLAAYRALDDLYVRVMFVLAAAGIKVATAERTFARLVMPDGPPALPALQVTVVLIVPAPEPTGRNTP